MKDKTIYLLAVILINLLVNLILINITPQQAVNEQQKDKVLTRDGLFNYDSNVRITSHTDINGNDYLIINIQSSDSSFHFDKPLPIGVNKDEYIRSYYAMFKGGSL